MRSNSLNPAEIIILGIVQGLTEFLPVSSTGHLRVAQELLGWTNTDEMISLDIFLHLPTILAVIFFFRKDLAGIFRQLFGKAQREERQAAMHLISLILAGMVATTFVYFLFKEPIHSVFDNPKLVGIAFLLTSIALGTISLKKDGKLSQVDLTIWHALLIGAAQGIAITPGLSRSGMTICAALLIGLRSEEAFRYSFLLSIPTIIIAWLFDIITNPGALSNLSGAGMLSIGFLIAFLFGLLAIYLLKGAVLRRKLWVFAIYLVPVGIFTLTYNF